MGLNDYWMDIGNGQKLTLAIPLYQLEYSLLTMIATFIGLSQSEFYNLPRKDPQFCTVLFDLADLVFRIFNSEIWELRAADQDEMLKEREEFKKKISKDKDKEKDKDKKQVS